MEKSIKDKRWMNIHEAADYAGYTVGALYKKVWRREFPFCRDGSRRLKFDRLAIDAFLEKGEVKAFDRDQAAAL